MKDGCIPLNGLRYFYRMEGSGKLLLLLHGFTGSSETWRSHMPVFAAKGYCVAALDLPGHGKTEIPANINRFGLEAVYKDIAQFIAFLGATQQDTILLGYSMGARTALYAALQGVCGALILESGSPGLNTEAERALRRDADERLAKMLDEQGVPQFIEYWERIPLFASQARLPQEILAEQKTQRLANSAAGLAGSLRGAGTGVMPNLRPQLTALTIPTLLISGELDEKYTAIATECARQAPNAQTAVCRTAGHAVHLEDPEWFRQTTLNFIHGGVYV